MATLTQQSITRTAFAPTYAAVSGGGDAAPCGPNVFLHVKNTGGSTCTVTVAVPTSASPWPNTPYAQETFGVPATTGDIMFGPIQNQLFADPVTGLATITYSATTGVTIACLSLSSL